MRKVYLDHASTTYTDPEVFEAMKPYFSDKYGNPESLHEKGKEALMAVDDSRETVAKILNCKPSEIVFTSGGTEANNLAIFGTAHTHVITTKIEHSSVLEPFTQLQKRGIEVTFLDVDKEGFVKTDDIKKALRPDTSLVSIIYANNEIGTIQNIKEIGELLANHGAIFHTDACQAMGACSLDTQDLKVDLMTLNSSKIYGPKGVGALYVKRGTKIEPLIYGGPQENNLRGGTHNTPGIVGFAKALELIVDSSEKNTNVTQLRDKLINELLKIPRAHLNGPQIQSEAEGESNPLRLPNNVNITFPGVPAQEALLHLDNAGIYSSAGAACGSSCDKPSTVLTAIGLPIPETHSTLRLTLGKHTTVDDIDYAIKKIPEIIKSFQ